MNLRLNFSLCIAMNLRMIGIYKSTPSLWASVFRNFQANIHLFKNRKIG